MLNYYRSLHNPWMNDYRRKANWGNMSCMDDVVCNMLSEMMFPVISSTEMHHVMATVVAKVVSTMMIAKYYRSS